MTREELYKAAENRANDVARETREKTTSLERQKENIVHPQFAPRGLNQGEPKETTVFKQQIDGNIQNLNNDARNRIDKIVDGLPKDTPDAIKQSIKDSSNRILEGQFDGQKAEPRNSYDKGYNAVQFNAAAKDLPQQPANDGGKLTAHFNEKAGQDKDDGGTGRGGPTPPDPGNGPDRPPPTPDQNNRPSASRFLNRNTPEQQGPESRQQDQTKGERPSASNFLNRGNTAGKDTAQPDKTAPQPERPSASRFLQRREQSPDKGDSGPAKETAKEAPPARTGSGRDDR